MSAPPKLAAFAVALAVALGAGYGVGAAIGPEPAGTDPVEVRSHGH